MDAIGWPPVSPLEWPQFPAVDEPENDGVDLMVDTCMST